MSRQPDTDPRNSPIAEPFRSTLNGFAEAMSRVAPKALPPIREAHEIMLAKLCAVTPPRITVSPEPDEFEATAEYLLDVARIVDAMMLAVGKEVKSNAGINIDLAHFTSPLTDALTGFAVYEINRAAENIREERAA